MKQIIVTRAHLKSAVENQNWDLLDKLLETDNSKINDTNLFTDTWGEWWGMLFHCVKRNYETGVKVLLKHGAKRSKGNWGDCIPMSPLEAAEELKHHGIVKLLKSKEKPVYERTTEPEIPELTEKDRRVNQQGDIADETGLVFNVE